MRLAFAIIILLPGCATTKVSVIHDEIPCVIVQTEIDLVPGLERIYEKTTIDCAGERPSELLHLELEDENGGA